MTTSTPKNMYTGQVPTSAGSAEYTVPAATTTIMKNIELVNTTGQIISAWVYVVKSGDAAGDQNALLIAYQVYPSSQGGGFKWKGEKVMDTGDFLQIFSSVTGITAHVNGVEIS